jgi:hypothetical protein
MSETGPIPPAGSTPPTPGPTPPPAGGPPIDYGTTAAGAYTGPEPDKDSKMMALLAHILGIPLGPLGPLIIWLIKKDQSPFVDDQGKEALNFQLMLLIGYIIGSVTMFVCIGFIIVPAVAIVSIIFSIMAAIKANAGIAYRYPFNLRLIK